MGKFIKQFILQFKALLKGSKAQNWPLASYCLLIFFLYMLSFLESICFKKPIWVFFFTISSVFSVLLTSWLQFALAYTPLRQRRMILDILSLSLCLCSGLRPMQGSAVMRERKKYIYYSCYAWGTTGLISLVTAVMEFTPSVTWLKPGFGKRSCLFNGKSTSRTGQMDHLNFRLRQSHMPNATDNNAVCFFPTLVN